MDSSRSLDDMVPAAAMHEAGHVVSSFALGFPVQFSILRRTDNRLGGYTEHAIPTSDLAKGDRERALEEVNHPDLLRKRAVQALAGAMAERAVNHDEDDVDKGAHGDYLGACRYALASLRQTAAATLDDDDAQTEALTAYINERNDEAWELLRPLMGSVVRVANYLIEHINEEVPGEVLSALIEQEVAA